MIKFYLLKTLYADYSSIESNFKKPQKIVFFQWTHTFFIIKILYGKMYKNCSASLSSKNWNVQIDINLILSSEIYRVSEACFKILLFQCQSYHN